MSTEKMSSNVIKVFPEILEKQYFQNPETKEFWFHATGACNSLGYKNVTSALALHCDDDEKLMEIVDGKATWFVSEAGFYGLAMGAKTKKAKEFKRWIKHDILPKLRADGGYIMPTATSEQLEALQSQINMLQKRNNELNHEVVLICKERQLSTLEEMESAIAGGNLEFVETYFLAHGSRLSKSQREAILAGNYLR